MVASALRTERATVGGLHLHPAAESDLAGLLALEQACFATDRISERSWQRLLRSASAAILLASYGKALAGALVQLFNRETDIARVYSIAVDARFRQHGVARRLIDAAVVAADERGSAVVRLETRVDNTVAQNLFAAAGFTPFGGIDAYYEDGANALRLERAIWTGAEPDAATNARLDAILPALGQRGDVAEAAAAVQRLGIVPAGWTNWIDPAELTDHLATGGHALIRLRGSGTPRLAGWCAATGFDGRRFRIRLPGGALTSLSLRDLSRAASRRPVPALFLAREPQ